MIAKHFALSSDDYVKFCPNVGTPLSLEDQTWTVGDRSYLSFTITSGSSGVYKVALYVTEDGYLWTNAFNWQHLFNIGEDACGRIIHYAKENSTEVERDELYEKLSSRYNSLRLQKNISWWMISILCKLADGITHTRFC